MIRSKSAVILQPHNIMSLSPAGGQSQLWEERDRTGNERALELLKPSLFYKIDKAVPIDKSGKTRIYNEYPLSVDTFA